MKLLIIMLFSLTVMYADGLTINHLRKFKDKYGWSESKILRLVQKKGFTVTDDTYFELEELGFSESFIDTVITGKKIKSQTQIQKFDIPDRIKKHYNRHAKTLDISALVIGINKYKSKKNLPALHAARSDAELFVKELLSQGVSPNEINLLTDNDATKSNIVKAIEWAKKTQGSLYVFFSGHGLTMNNEFYFACHDTNPKDIETTAYSMSNLKSKLQQAQSKHVVVLLDACHSGASKNARFNTKRRKRENKTSETDTYATLGLDQSGSKQLHTLEDIEKPIFLMVSCGANQYSWQGTQNSHFTHFLIEGMRGKADRDKNNVIDTLELSSFVRDNVVRETQGQQKPDFSQSRGWEWEFNKSAGIKLVQKKQTTKKIESSTYHPKIPNKFDLYNSSNLVCEMRTSYGTVYLELFQHSAPKTVKNFIDLAEGRKEFTDVRTQRKVMRPYYDGLIFHRVIPKFMIQGGCPLGIGTGGPGYEFADEISAKSLGLDTIKAFEGGRPHQNLGIRSQQQFQESVLRPLLKNLGISSQEELQRRSAEVQATVEKLTLEDCFINQGYQYNNMLKSYHHKRGILAMANSGPNTNGSQFFINVIDTPWLDGKHTTFGRVIKGMDVVDRIANAKTDSNNKPINQIIIYSIRLAK